MTVYKHAPTHTHLHDHVEACTHTRTYIYTTVWFPPLQKVCLEMRLICLVSESKALTPILAAWWFAPPCGMCSRNSLHLTRGWSNPRQGWRVYPEHRAGLGWMGLWDIFSLAISAPYMKKKKLSRLEAQSVHTYSHVYMSVSLYLSIMPALSPYHSLSRWWG